MKKPEHELRIQVQLWRRVRDSNPGYLRTQHFECCTFDHSDNSPYRYSAEYESAFSDYLK